GRSGNIFHWRVYHRAYSGGPKGGFHRAKTQFYAYAMVYIPIHSSIVIAAYGIPPINRHHTRSCRILLLRRFILFPVQAAYIIQVVRERMFKIALRKQFKLLPQSEAYSRPNITIK